MVIVEITFKKPREELVQYIDAHRSFFQKYYDEGLFVMSGPVKPGPGGFLISLGELNEVKDILSADPLNKPELAGYRFIEFHPAQCCDELSSKLGI